MGIALLIIAGLTLVLVVVLCAYCINYGIMLHREVKELKKLLVQREVTRINRIKSTKNSNSTPPVMGDRRRDG